MMNMLFQALSFLTITMVVKFLVAGAIIAFTYGIVQAISPFLHDLCKKNQLDHHTCHLINKIARYTITILGFTIALQNLGIDVSMLVAAFGITGIVLSYGMKDIVANFIAGILIMGYKYIKLDDYIKTKDWEGRVIDINLRYTTLRTEQMTVLIPNLMLYTHPVAILEKK